MRAIRIHRTGGPEVLQYQEVDDRSPGSSEVLIRIQAIGVNFIDIYHRSGVYPSRLPLIPGVEAAGIVEETGSDVEGVEIGSRVACTGAFGAYAEKAIVPAEWLIPIPAKLNPHEAAAALLQGMTAHYLTTSTYPLKEGDIALVHAGAGGVGLLLIQMAKSLGARVITTVSTKQKVQLAEEAGADTVVNYTETNFTTEVKAVTGDKGVQVVYDSVGQATYDQSLNCLAPRGTLVLFGQSSGFVPPREPNELARGSFFLTRPRLDDYTHSREDLLWRAGEVFSKIQSGALNIRIDTAYPLTEAHLAHESLAGRKTTGKVLLIP